MQTATSAPPLTRGQAWWDVALAAVCCAVAVPIHAFGIDAVPANREPDALSLFFTVTALAPLAVRRRAPLAVLIACFPGIFALILGHYAVAAAPVGPIIAFYTAIAWDIQRNARRAVAVVIAAAAITGALRPVDLALEGALANTAVFVGGWVIGTGTRERRERSAALTAAGELQLTLERERADLATDRALLAATSERLRISRDLHDVLGHAFSVMVVQAGVAERLLDSDPVQARRALHQVSATGRASLSDLRSMLRVLRDGDTAPGPAGSDLGLADVAALAGRVEAVGLALELTLPASSAPSHAGVELAAYRVIQESLTNVLKHAGASKAWVRIERDDAHLDVEVHDNGSATEDGAATGADATGGAQGLAGMRERVAIYGGRFQAGPAPDGGWRVHAVIPFPGTTRAAPAGGAPGAAP